ncbi:protein DDI1 homolog 2 isoform X1 [Anguilla rostrata]|uniref:protein DDI1 homolog 2 isoform X1 n=1 Tax=Anguilla rostrata TaxID=7938 RepID=UPI0030D41CA5
MNTEDAESLAPTAMEVGGAGGGGGTGSPALPSPSHPEPSTLQTGRELEETQSTDAKNTHACVSGAQDEQDEQEEGRGVEMDAACAERPCSAPRDPELEPGLGLHGEGDLASQPRRDSGPSSHLAMDTPLEAQATPPVERDQPEGEQQPNFDTMPSLAAALKELHQLLVANKHMLSQERSPTPSPSPSPACREDADGVDDGPAARSQPAALDCARAPTAAAETGAAGLESAPVPLPARPAGSRSPSGYAGSPGGGEAEAMDGEKACGDSEAGGEQMEDVERRAGSEPEVSAPPQQDLELREPPEGQLGRGVADGRAVGPNAPDPLPSPMEVAPPNAPPATADPPRAAPAAPDEDPRVPPHVSRPLPPSSSSAAPPPRAPSDRFPAAHIQKIQAAGFSASEAAEALEQVQGHVELALLMLLARKITVPS